MKKSIIFTIFIVFIVIFTSGCITPPNDNTTSQPNNAGDSSNFSTINLSAIALSEDDVQMNETNPLHLTKPREHKNAAGFGKTWNVLEQYQSKFSTAIASTPKDPQKRVTQIITKLESIQKAEEYMSLKIDNLINDNGYEELNEEVVGNSSFYLVKDIPVNNTEFRQYLCYFSFNNLIINVGGTSTHRSDIINYARIIEGKIIDYISK
jgi:hypothetical protein